MKHDLARKLRRNQTDAERKLWYLLRDRRFCGFKFRRQQPIGPYVVDFICFEKGLVVELDGAQHGTDEAVAYDVKRTAFLESQGLRVMRFWNHEVNEDIEGLSDTIGHALGVV